jgi:hypothetical protein
MAIRIHSLLSALTLTVSLIGAGLAQAADPVTDLMLAANAPYRMALYKTNGKLQDDAQKAVQQAKLAWSQLASQFAAKPAAPYDRDPAFAASVAEVAKVYEQALKEVGAGQLATAHTTLERVREVMADMRQRNGVVVYSDHMNAYHSQMELLMIHGGETLAQPKGLLLMTGQVGALSYLAKQLEVQAPAELKKNDEFASLLKALNQSVSNLEAALLNQDMAAAKEATGKLKGPYSKLFSKFG